MNVTLSDIARHVGTSKMTVSQALRGTGRVGSTTRQRILAAAGELGYRPNAAAQAVSTGRFGCVALLQSVLGLGRSTLPDILLAGLEGTLSRHNVHLTITRLPDEQLTSDGFVPKILRHAMADGLIINYAEKIPQKMIELIDANGLPAVWINAKRPYDCVHPDDFDAGHRLTRHLLQLGHRRIAYVDHSHGTDTFAQAHYSAIDRLAGCQAAMREAGLTLQLFQSPQSLRGPQRQQAAMQYLAQPDRPTALIGYGDNNVAPAAIAAARLGLRIPQDLLLATFADRPLEVGGEPVLTAIVPQGPMGTAAVEMLLEKINNPAVRHPCRTVPFQLPLAEETS